jgi:uncharacterized protein HemY
MQIHLHLIFDHALCNLGNSMAGYQEAGKQRKASEAAEKCLHNRVSF